MPLRFITNRVKAFFIYRVLHIDDTPHRIALGLAVGIFITWTPLIGLQMILTVLLSALLRANKFVGVPFVWISNPVTAVPLYGMNYLVGTWVLPGSHSKGFAAAVKDAMWSDLGLFERIGAWWAAMWQFFLPLWVGSILVGLALAILTYFITRSAVIRYRIIRDRLHRLHERRAAAKAKAKAKAKVEKSRKLSTH